MSLNDDYIKSLCGVEKKYSELLHINANENVMSHLAKRFYQSDLSQRYKMGRGMENVFVHGNFSAKAMPEIEDIIISAESIAKKTLNSEVVNLNLLSGVHAMISSILCTTKPGDAVMSVLSRHGGHFCTKGILEMTGRRHFYTEYNYENMEFDIEKIKCICNKENIKAIYLDTSVLLKPLPIKKLREQLGNDVVIIYDASHTLGLIMSGFFQDPLMEGADVISANTHKTLPGPHHGMIAFRNKELGEYANRLMDGSLYSSTHVSEVLSLAITILEIEKWGKEFSEQIINNANFLAKCLEAKGYEVRKASTDKYTYNHQIHLFCDMPNDEIVSMFLKNGISVNTSRALGERLFIRIGLQEVTRRGMKESEMVDIANFISEILSGKKILLKVKKFNMKFNKILYGFDYN